MSATPTVICLTPVRNEAWILDRFFRCASVWADHIVVAEQGSDDGSLEIARAYPKVTLLENPSATFNEPERQKMLIAAARRFPGPRILVALDADEALTANFRSSPDWAALLAAAPGTVVYFRWANLRPGVRSYWSPVHSLPFAFVDDGSDHVGKAMHNPRVPVPPGAPQLRLQDIRVLHYQYADWDRMESKHRWYQCLERLAWPSRSAIEIYRTYHHMYEVRRGDVHGLPDEWLSGYEALGIDMRSIGGQATYWWDREVLNLFASNTAERFRREAIWGVDWTALAKTITPGTRVPCEDPRSVGDRLAHRWLSMTQPYQTHALVRRVDRVLASWGW